MIEQRVCCVCDTETASEQKIDVETEIERESEEWRKNNKYIR